MRDRGNDHNGPEIKNCNTALSGAWGSWVHPLGAAGALIAVNNTGARNAPKGPGAFCTQLGQKGAPKSTALSGAFWGNSAPLQDFLSWGMVLNLRAQQWK